MAYDAPINASNHIYLNGTTQSVPYPIISGIEVCYYDVDTKAFVKDTASNPYTMTTSHSSLFSSTIALTDEDLAELTSDTNKIYRIWFGSETLESGFYKTNIGNFYGGSEGLASGAYIQDLSVDLGSETVINGEFTTDLSGWTDTNSYWTNVSGRAYHALTATLNSLHQSFTSNGNMDRLIFELDIVSGSMVVEATVDGILTANTYSVSGTYTLFGNNITKILFKRATETEFYVDNISTREASAVEIQEYDAATRTTLANQTKGASNLKLIRDGSGRTTGIAAANTTQWEADGRTAVTGWIITAPFTITEITNDDTDTYLSNGNRYKNGSPNGTYTVPTGIWTLDNTRFDGTAGVTKRGNTKMVNSLQIP